MQLTPIQKEQFNSLGYLLIPINVNSHYINDALQGAILMRHRAIENKYQFTRTYFDHISNWNLAAIEAPFHSSILDERLKNLLAKMCLGNIICQLMNWSETCCTVARLFSMGNYKYRGNWHRDHIITKQESPVKCTDVIQAEILLEPQSGFRYMKKDWDLGGVNSIIDTPDVSRFIETYPFPLSPPSQSFHILGGDAGTVLLFNPSRLHQGSTQKRRFDLHLRFENKLNYIFQNKKLINSSFLDFSLAPELDEHINPFELMRHNLLPITQPRRLINRINNTINYRTGIYNFIRSKKLKKGLPQSWSIDVLSNTVFQKN